MTKLRFKPEKVAGIVALSYLVLIPAAGVYLWRRQEMVEAEVADVWHHLNVDPILQDVRRRRVTGR